MTRLADRFTLYAPDLRGFGDTTKAETGYDKKSMQFATDVTAKI